MDQNNLRQGILTIQLGEGEVNDFYRRILLRFNGTDGNEHRVAGSLERFIIGHQSEKHKFIR